MRSLRFYGSRPPPRRRLHGPEEPVASILFTLTVAVNLTATLGWFLRRNGFCLGFALFGWAAILLAFGSGPGSAPLPLPLSTLILQAMLPSTLVVNFSDSLTVHNLSTNIGVTLTGGTMIVPVAYLQVGSSLLSLGFATMGGLVGHVIASRGEGSRS